MKYYIIVNQRWVKATQYNLSTMRQINLYDYMGGKMEFIGVGLYKAITPI